MTPFVLLAAFLITASFTEGNEPLCYGHRSNYRATLIGEHTERDLVLFGHVFATYQVQNFSECFLKCGADCRCRSFNLPETSRGNCELNDAGKETVVLKPRRGWRYHHIETMVKSRGTNTEYCQKVYKNGCCSPNPCKHGGNCSEHEGRGKPGFDCTCPAGFIGPLCQKSVTSCLDYLWNNKDSPSGSYDVWIDGGLNISAYCDMRNETFGAWTLVMSHRRQISRIVFSKALFVDLPINASSPNFESYRLPLATMKRILQGIGKSGTAEWRMTCDYSFKSGSAVGSRQWSMVSSRFETLDIMKFESNANGSICHRVDYINIYGKKYYNRNIWAMQNDNNAFTINAYQEDGCNIQSSSKVNYTCALSTQYWFGGRLFP